MKEKIVVVGGYGHVGGGICERLGALYPGKVYAAGRSLDKSEAYSRTTQGRVKPMKLDSRTLPEADWFREVAVVVMCLDQQETHFAESCLRNGVHYIDVAASGDWFEKVEGLADSAKAGGSSAILSVGLAPGLTNLLARTVAEGSQKELSIEIGIMLGLGDSHGKAAIDWTVKGLTEPFEVMEQGEKVIKQSFSEGRTAYYGHKLGRHKGYRFPFSDQAALPRSLGASSVSTRLCFDSRLVTGLLAFLAPLGLRRLLKWKVISKLFASSMGGMKFGSDVYALSVESFDGDQVRGRALLNGRNESDITAAAAAATAKLVYEGAAPTGIFHSEELFTLVASGRELWLESRPHKSNQPVTRSLKPAQARIEARDLIFDIRPALKDSPLTL
ncbi:saccharopine dehydrogenase family protein [Paenibacillus sp. CAU 1782]